MTAADTRAMCWLLQQPQAARRARMARLVSRLGDGPFYVALTLLIWWMDRQGGSEFDSESREGRKTSEFGNRHPERVLPWRDGTRQDA